MISYKTIRIDPDDWTMITGKTKHEVDLPFAEKDLDLWVEWRASEDVMLWLYFADGKRLPYVNGSSGHCSIRTRNVISLVITCSKKDTVLAVSVSYKDLMLNESKTDWTPVEIIPPDPVQLKLAEAVQKELMRLGVLTDKDSTIDLDEEDNLEEDDPEDEFGAGYMDEEQPLARPRRGAARSSAEPGPSDDAGGDNDNPGGPSDADSSGSKL